MKHGKVFLPILAFICASSLSATQESVKTTQILSITETTTVTKEQSPDTKKVAIFVRNDSGKPELNDKAKALEFALSTRLNNMGFGVINQDLVVRNLNAYLGDPNAKYRSQAEKLKKNVESEALDSKLFAEASGLRMGELIGADYLMSVSFASLGSEKKTFGEYGVKTQNIAYNLRSNYNLYEGGAGSGTAGGAIKSSKNIRQTANLSTESDDILNELIEDSADQMAALLDKQNKASLIASKEASEGALTVIYSIEDLSFPEIKRNDKGKFYVTTNVFPTTIAHVNADIDGIAQTIGGKIELSKGLHTLRINQKDIVPIEKNIFVTGKSGQQLAFNLQLTDEARNRWKADMQFLEEMKNRASAVEERRILTEAEAQRILGIAKMFSQSGYKVDAKALPEIHKTQSIFGQ